MPGMANTMREYKNKTLHSGSKSGPVVQKRSQAIAIGLDEMRRAGKKVSSRSSGRSKGR